MSARRLLLLTVAVSAFGCADDTPAPVHVSLSGTAQCTGDENACVTSDAARYMVDGIRVVHRRIVGAPTVSVQISFAHGGRPAKHVWAEQLALQLLGQNGSTLHDSASWSKALARLDAHFGAFDGGDFGRIIAGAPAPRWDEIWSLLVQALHHPNSDGFEWRRSSILRSYMSELDDPGNAAGVTAWSMLYAGHPYNRQRENLDTLQEVTAEDISDAWSSLRTKQRMTVVVVGDVSADDVQRKVRAAFGKFDEDAPSIDIKVRLVDAPDQAHAKVLDYPAAPTWHISGQMRGPEVDGPDYPAFAAGLEVLSNQLFIEVREKQGLAYTVGASASDMRDAAGSIWLSTTSPAQAFPIARDTIANLLSAGPSEDELRAAVESLRSEFFENNTVESDVAATLDYYEECSGDALRADDYPAALQKLTVVRVRDVLRRYVRNVQLVAAGAGEELDDAALLNLVPEYDPVVK